MIRFEQYQSRYYQQVCDFLIELNKENHFHDNWNWARFEWMHEHPLTQKELLGYMGLWFDDGRIVGASLIDMFFGEAFVGVLPKYQRLFPEITKHAFDNLRNEQGLGIAFHDDNEIEIQEAVRQGFSKADASETVSEIVLDQDCFVLLPDGFRAEAFDAQANPMDIEWLMWQGFDHGVDKKEFLKQYKEPTGRRPHFNPYLCIVIKNEQDELVASASTWYDSKTDYAYVEPVCVLPKYRKIGLGKAAIYTALQHAKELGAKTATVISDQEFYKRLGFKQKSHYSFYWKKP